MMTFLRATSAAAMLTMTACAATAQDTSQSNPVEAAPDDLIPMTASEDSGIREQIEAQWNVTDGVRHCHKPVELRVHLDPDGTVSSVDPLGDVAADADCAQAVRMARNAVLKASPLKVPSGKHFSSIKLRFNPETE